MEGLESFFTSTQQLSLFVMSCLMGLPVGLIFDLFRAVRMTFPHGKAAVIVEDILFFGLYSVLLMCFTTAFARSEFRFYYPIGNILGFTVYYLTIGSFISKLLRKIISFLKGLFGKPVKKIVPIYKKITSKFVRSFQNAGFTKKNTNTPLIDDGDLLYNSSTEIKNKRKNVKKIVSKKTKKRQKT